jgi:hypothetical protein
VLKLDQQTHTASLAAQYGASRNLNSDYMGDTQPLANGNVFVGWGSQPYSLRVQPLGQAAAGRLLPRLGPQLPGHGRAVGRPSALAPAAPRFETDGKTTVYASWNGATRVASWKVLAGPRAVTLTAVDTSHEFGFETAITLPQRER